MNILDESINIVSELSSFFIHDMIIKLLINEFIYLVNISDVEDRTIQLFLNKVKIMQNFNSMLQECLSL